MLVKIESIFCDDVLIGTIAICDKTGKFHGFDIKGDLVDKHTDRPTVYRSVRNKAADAGILYRVRKGVYRDARKTS